MTEQESKTRFASKEAMFKYVDRNIVKYGKDKAADICNQKALELKQKHNYVDLHYLLYWMEEDDLVVDIDAIYAEKESD